MHTNFQGNIDDDVNALQTLIARMTGI